MSTPWDLDELIASGEIEVDPVHARRERQRAQWALADIAFRSDVGYSIAMAKAASAAREKASGAPIEGTETKAERQRRYSRESYHRRRAQKAAEARSEPTA